ncbi:membrane-associated, eicosanoid/glutathione metabolism protein [Annulohypoxylon moriforme]|nr:membrane-associated, eicosanoid/glutathione metabolism protein [Annulohypoxylon moriforme]
MTSQPSLHLPITGAFALPFAAYYIVLSVRVGLQRIKQRVAIGDRVPPPPSSPTSSTPTQAQTPTTKFHTTSDPLHLATRAQQNFAEFVPLALLLSTIAELNGASPRILRGALATLLVARMLHVEGGILRPGAMGWGRPVGFYGTLGVLGGLAWVAGGW